MSEPGSIVARYRYPVVSISMQFLRYISAEVAASSAECLSVTSGSLDRGVTFIAIHSIVASIELSLGLPTLSPPDDRAGNSLVELIH